MGYTLSLILLALAVSIDSFSVGFTYGLRKMQIPFKSIVIIAGCSAIVLMLAMVMGHVIQKIISPHAAESIGGILLIILGAWVIFQFYRPEKKVQQPVEKTIVNFEIKSLGLVIHILRKPMSADFDQSGTITGIEAIMLGFALSLDAFGAGIGAAMLGFSPFYLALTVAFMSSLFVYIGLKSGRLLSGGSWLEKFSFIPGVILIIIGIWKM
ncbi:sporulation membrane protein YtaF [Cytobacillus sp. Hz8]|uniref:sporulation membrane protein YtaF n=1 Tax=Cytobacillus sp. Hz8 TaxID=3347168 RepID=UPI0035E0D660